VTIRNRFRMIVGLATAGMLVLSVCWLVTEHSRLRAERRNEARFVVEAARGLAQQQLALERQGLLSREQAQQNMLAYVRVMRYDNGNYLWISDMDGKMLMHPTKPQFNGKNLNSLTDRTGKYYHLELSRIAQAHPEGGYLSYYWPRPNGTEPVRKEAFVQGIPEWDWYIGTGVYLDDVEAAWRSNALHSGLVCLIVLGILLLTARATAKAIFPALNVVTERMALVAEESGKALHEISQNTQLFKRNDEVGVLVCGFNRMVKQVHARDEQLARHREQLESTVMLRTEELRKAHRNIEVFLLAIPSILIGLNRRGFVTRWNQTAEQVFGVEAKDAIGEFIGCCGVQWVNPTIGAEIVSWLNTDVVLRCNDIAYQRSGKVRFLVLNVRPIPMDVDAEGGVIITGSDITEQKCMEEQLLQSQKLEAIGQLASGVAHEINTPTQFIGDNTRFLRESWDNIQKLLELCRRMREEASTSSSISSELLEEFARIAEQSDLEYLEAEIPQALDQSLDGVQRVAKIVKAMKDFSHPDKPELQMADINHVIETAVTIGRNEWKYVAEMDLQLEESLPSVECLPGELGQTMLNLIINAAHAIGEKTNDGADGKGLISIATRSESHAVHISVRDTFTTKPMGKGTGQGLYMACATITKKHHGKIWFESTAGEGATFHISLPVRE